MIVLRVIVNAVLMAAEIAAIAGLAWLGWQHPYAFAIATGLVAFGLGIHLDYERLKHEYPFYFESDRPKYLWGLRIVSLGDSFVKGLIAALVALLTFAGNDDERRLIAAVVFAVAVYAGASILRRLSISFGAKPAHWGFFRLAVPMGLVFSGGIAVAAAMDYIKVATLTDIGRQLVFDMPAKPNIEQVSDLLFSLKQYIDSVIATLLANLMPTDWAQILSLIISVNVLTGFIVALYALIIAEAVRWAERRMVA
jgi:hypothetical protein